MLTALYKKTVPWVKASKRQIAKNRILGLVANIFYPLFCLTHKIKPFICDDNQEERVVVSLTSYPARIKKVVLCVNSLLRQTYRADCVVLYLSKKQFPNGIRDLPKALIKLTFYGLTINFVDEDYRSYKKFFYAAKGFNNCVIVTADDDALYPEDWLERLIETHKKNRDCVVCYRAHLITFNKMKVSNGYNDWQGLSADILGPNMQLCPIGVGGVLYPTGFFSPNVCDIEKIRLLCPTTDDLWLKAMGVINGFSVVKVLPNSREWFTVRGSQSTNLMSANVATSKSLNDEAWKNLENEFSLSEKIIAYRSMYENVGL